MSDTKICANQKCPHGVDGKPKLMTRPSGMSRHRWENERKFCCASCARDGAVQTRNCIACGEVLVHDKSRECKRTFYRRETCRTEACRLAAKAMKAPPQKECPVCGTFYDTRKTRGSCGAPACVKVRRRNAGLVADRTVTARHGSARERIARAIEAMKPQELIEFAPPPIKTDDMDAWLAAARVKTPDGRVLVGIDAIRARSIQYSGANDALGPVPIRPRTGRDGRV